jgi:hypothetical protein
VKGQELKWKRRVDMVEMKHFVECEVSKVSMWNVQYFGLQLFSSYINLSQLY